MERTSTSSNWVQVVLDQDLVVREATLGAFVALAGCRLGSPASEMFSIECRAQAISELAGLADTGHVRGLWRGAKGPIEVHAFRRRQWIDLYIRPHDGGNDADSDLDFFFRSLMMFAMPTAFTDLGGNVLDANQSLLELYGYQREEFVGQNIRLLKSGRQDPDMYAQLWSHLMDPRQGVWCGELINRRKCGDEVIVVAAIRRVSGRDGERLGFVVNYTDVTGLKALESELRLKNEELEALNGLKNEVMAATSHDLKSPIASMVSYASLMLDRRGDLPEEKTRAYLEEIVDSGHRLAGFIDEVLDITKFENGRQCLSATRVRLDVTLRSCIEKVRLYAAECGVDIALRVSGHPCPTSADLVKMERVFDNLLSNAIKFSPHGTTIEVEYRTLVDEVEIRVRDRGPGIAEDELDRVFERYYRSSKDRTVREFGKGTGLGLAICRGAVELHGGAIWAENVESGGCRITLRMPLRSTSAISALIFDPADELRLWVAPVLAESDVERLYAGNVSELRRIFEYERPNLIFLGRETLGGELLRTLQTEMARDLRQPLVVVLGTNAMEAPDWARVVTAPISPSEVRALVHESRSRTASLL